MNLPKPFRLAILLLLSTTSSIPNLCAGRPAGITVLNNSDNGPGSLREVVENNTNGFPINFEPSLSGQVITLTNGEIVIGTNMTIDASSLSRSVQLNGNNSSRIFYVVSGVTNTLNSLTFTNCNATPGGAIYSEAGSSLTIRNCTFVNNQAQEGGAILNDGNLLLSQCTFHGNRSAYGGGLQSRASTVVYQCTFSGNNSPFGGGGIFNKYPTLVIENSIIAGNTSSQDPGQDVYNQLGSLVFSGANIVGALNEDRATVPDAGPAPLSVDPALSPLADHGGPTLTMLPSPGSPAIDAGAVGLNEIQQVLIGDGVSAFDLKFNGQTTPSMSPDSSAAAVQSALNSLSSISGAGGSVSVTLTNSIYTVIFGGAFADQSQPQITAESLDGPVTVSTIVNGVEMPQTDQRGTGFPRNVGNAPDIGAVEAQTPPAPGNYNGLFSERAGVNQDSAGSFTAKVSSPAKNSANEKFSAKLGFSGKTYSFSGQLDASGQSSNSIARKDLPALIVRLFSASENGLLGHVTDGNWNADLSADRAMFDSKTNPAPEAGKYTFEIFGGPAWSSTPAGNGIGAVTVASNGVVVIKGSLADGTAVTRTTALGQSGRLPIFIPANGGTESIYSWVTFDNATPRHLYGPMSWIKKGSAKGRLYASGFTNETALAGAQYTPPPAGQAILTFTNCTAFFNGGNFTNVTLDFTLDVHNKAHAAADPSFSLAVSPTTGLFSGKVTDPVTLKPVILKGAILQSAEIGIGYVISADESASLFIPQTPP